MDAIQFQLLLTPDDGVTTFASHILTVGGRILPMSGEKRFMHNLTKDGFYIIKNFRISEDGKVYLGNKALVCIL